MNNRMSEPGTPLQPNYMKIFVQRDYSDGTSVKFQTRFPSELEGRIERHIFESTINRLNEYFAEAEKGSCSTYCEGFLACITAYLVYMCSETHYEKCLRKISKYIASQKRGVHLKILYESGKFRILGISMKKNSAIKMYVPPNFDIGNNFCQSKIVNKPSKIIKMFNAR